MSFESPVYSIQDLYRRNNGSPDFFSQFNSARSCARKRPQQRSSSLPNDSLHPYYLGSGRRNTMTESGHGIKGTFEWVLWVTGMLKYSMKGQLCQSILGADGLMKYELERMCEVRRECWENILMIRARKMKIECSRQIITVKDRRTDIATPRAPAGAKKNLWINNIVYISLSRSYPRENLCDADSSK